MSIITVSVFVGLSFHHHPCGHLQYVLHLKAFPGWQEGGEGVVMGFDVLNTVSIPDITVSSTMSSISPPLPIGQTWSSGRGRTYSTFFFFSCMERHPNESLFGSHSILGLGCFQPSAATIQSRLMLNSMIALNLEGRRKRITGPASARELRHNSIKC